MTKKWKFAIAAAVVLLIIIAGVLLYLGSYTQVPVQQSAAPTSSTTSSMQEQESLERIRKQARDLSQQIRIKQQDKAALERSIQKLQARKHSRQPSISKQKDMVTPEGTNLLRQQQEKRAELADSIRRLQALENAITKNQATTAAISSGPGEVDKILSKMKFGSIAFNVPTNINIYDTPEIHLILSLAEPVEKLKQAITQKGKKVGASIRVSDRMQARLTGSMFQITAITPETQAVSSTQRTEWKWDIHPMSEGKHKLHLTLSALILIDGESTQRAVKTYDKIIEVTITPQQEVITFIKHNWQWLWAAILVPVAGWIWRRKHKGQHT